MKKTFITAILIILYSVAVPQVAINIDGSTPDSSAMFEIKSDSLGFLPPRLTAKQIDSLQNPAPGMMIYNTTTHSLDFLTSVSSTNKSRWTRVDETGIEKSEPLFQIIYGGTMNDFFKDIIQTSDGGYLAVGRFEVSDNYYLNNTFQYLLAVKLKSDGTLDENFNASGGDFGNFACCYFNSNDNGKNVYKKTEGETVVETHNLSYILGGFFHYGVALGSLTGDFYAIKITPKGLPDKGGFTVNADLGFGDPASTGDAGRSIIETGDGGYLFAGLSSNNNNDCQIVKLTSIGEKDNSFNSPYGNIVFSTGGPDAFNAVIQTDDTGYLAVGQLDTKYLFATKLKSDGTLDTSFNHNGMLILEDSTNINDQEHEIWAHDVKQTPDGGFLICGDCKNTPAQPYAQSNAFVVKISPAGNIDHSFADNGILIFGDENSSSYLGTYCYSMAVTKDGGFVITGKIHSHIVWNEENGNVNIYVAKFNAQGSFDTGFGNSGRITIGTDNSKETAYSIKQTKDGSYIVAGETTLNQSNGNTAGFIAKIGPNGEVCANNSGQAGAIYTGMRFKKSTDAVTISHIGSITTDTPKYYHKGSITTVCNQ